VVIDPAVLILSVLDRCWRCHCPSPLLSYLTFVAVTAIRYRTKPLEDIMGAWLAEAVIVVAILGGILFVLKVIHDGTDDKGTGPRSGLLSLAVIIIGLGLMFWLTGFVG
jgi:hypothetical protein